MKWCSQIKHFNSVDRIHSILFYSILLHPVGVNLSQGKATSISLHFLPSSLFPYYLLTFNPIHYENKRLLCFNDNYLGSL